MERCVAQCNGVSLTCFLLFLDSGETLEICQA